ncbi:MAG: tetratricopeptide repeat protein [Verrucomicrobia bacterium]|nr:tetratricopeptide repeat protein [Verrucomicrobiota bacterium]
MPTPRPSASDQESSSRSHWPWGLAIGSVLIVLVVLLLPRQGTSPTAPRATNGVEPSAVADGTGAERARWSRSRAGAALTPEEIVAGKVTQFAHDRLRITRSMASRFKVSVAPDVERFFAAVAAGRWEELNAAFEALKQRRESGHAEDLGVLWGPILETLLIAECGHDWPAQKLLDYGQATLGSLRPGMVYVGGTDPGRGIPTLLNETGDGERHVVITQNALADGSYLRYLDFLYGDRVKTLTTEESQRAFQDYLSEAQKRLAHDQQFPDEPKQIRPGEDVRVVDGRVQVTGQIAVMAINEILLRTFMTKNPDLAFALEESFPLKSTYPNAVPLGPLMELGVQDVQNSFTRDSAAQAVNYWRDTAQQFLSDTAASADSAPRLSYAKMAAAQAALLADHQYGAEAEQAYRVAVQISPASPEAAYGLARLLATTGRAEEARQLVADFERAHPSKDPAPVWKFIYSGGRGEEAARR